MAAEIRRFPWVEAPGILRSSTRSWLRGHVVTTARPTRLLLTPPCTVGKAAGNCSLCNPYFGHGRRHRGGTNRAPDAATGAPVATAGTASAPAVERRVPIAARRIDKKDGLWPFWLVVVGV